MSHHEDGLAADATSVGQPITESGGRVDQKQLDPSQPLRSMTVDDLAAFFDASDLRETGPEPDWTEHLAIGDESRRSIGPA